MKVRSGFVSNSSTTSFCIYGAKVDFDNLKSLRKKIAEEEDESPEDISDEVIVEELDRMLGTSNHTSISTYYVPGDYAVHIGCSYLSMKGHETRDEFEKRIWNEVMTFIRELEENPSNFHFDAYEEAYY